MARLRTVKPEFWASEQIGLCSRDARLLFIGLWNFCDDAGIHPASTHRLKSEVFPADDCSKEDIDRWVNELISQELLIEYEASGKKYWKVTGWQHQKIQRPYLKYPQNSTKYGHEAYTEHIPVSDQAVNVPIPVYAQAYTEHIPSIDVYRDRDRNIDRDLELKITEEIIYRKTDNCGVNLPVSRDRVFVADEDILEVFKFWQSSLGHPRAALDGTRRLLISRSLSWGYTVQDLKNAITGCSYTPHNMGKNINGERYDKIENIFKDADQIDRFIKNYENPPIPKTKRDLEKEVDEQNKLNLLTEGF